MVFLFIQIDGETAVKQLSSRVSAEKILRTLSNVPEFSILVEGLDAITLGDVYKTAFPNGILRSISEHYLRSPSLGNNKAAITKPYNLESVKSTEIVADNEVEDTGIASEYDEVSEDDPQLSNEDLKEEPITDDYVYDQPIEDRFFGEREHETRQNNETDNSDTRGSKNMNYTLSESVDEVGHREKELSKYGAWFRNGIIKFLAG